MKNTLKTTFLLVLLSGLFLMMGAYLGGNNGLIVAFIFSLGMNFFSYWFSDRIILKMHRAEKIEAGHPSGLYEMVAELASRAKLPMPKVYLIPDHTPNAFATGRNPQNAAVAATMGLLKILDRKEVRAVMAHELGHVNNRDTLVSTIVASIASAVMFIGNMLKWTAILGGGRDSREGGGGNAIAVLLMAIVAPLAAMLIQFAISRSREFGADEAGARISGDPRALASALRKISDPRVMEMAAEGSLERPATSHLYIINHLSGGGVGLLSFFSTHPPTEERVKRLEAMSFGAGGWVTADRAPRI